MYCMGEDTEDTLASTNISAEDRKKYKDVIAKFDAFFRVRNNVTFERARFNQRCQGLDESAEQFITGLYSLSENCTYGDLRDEMIRDRIVVGIRDKTLSERLQLDPDLTLEKAKKLVRQREAVHKQQAMLRDGSKQEMPVDFVRYKPPLKQRAQKGGQSQFANSTAQKGAAEVNEYEDMAYLNTVASEQASASWNCRVMVNGRETPFKLDTGAEATVLSDNALESLNVGELQSSTKRLCGPDRRPLDVVGELSVTLSHKNRRCTQPVFVVRMLQQNLLGLPAIRALNLLTQVDAVAKSVPDTYPSLFTGLGTFPGSHKIKLNPDAQPFTLFTPRNVALPLRKKVQDELTRMESLGVISRVEEPTSWCAGMVVVPKRSGDVRICVDFRRLNESVQRETYPLPKVDVTLAQLSGATFFS